MKKAEETLNILLIREGEDARRFTALREKRGLKSNVELLRQIVHEAEEAVGIMPKEARQ
jgi:hypothetical protein